MRASFLPINISRFATASHRQGPTFAVVASDEFIRLGRVTGRKFVLVPLKFPARAVSDVAQVVRLGEPARVFEICAGLLPGFARLDPFGVMSGRARDRRRGTLESGEVLFRQQNM